MPIDIDLVIRADNAVVGEDYYEIEEGLVGKFVEARETGTNDWGTATGVVRVWRIVDRNDFPGIPSLTSVSGGVGELSFTIVSGSGEEIEDTQYRVRVTGQNGTPNPPGDGSVSAGYYTYETAGAKTVEVPAGEYSVTITSVWNDNGRLGMLS